MKSLVAIVTILCFSITLMQPVYAQQDADIETILKEGKEAYLNGDYNKAVEKLSVAVRFLRVKADLVDANITLALAYLALGDDNNCQRHIKEALKIAPDISLSTDEYSPKFIELLNTTKKDNIIQVIFRITPAATLYLNGFKVQEGDVIEIPVLRGENSIKAVKQGYATFEQDMLLNESGAIKEIKLDESDVARNGVIEKAGIKKKKKFPWLLVIGGALVLGAIIYFLVLKKPKFTLETEVGEGVTGTPSSGSKSYNKDETVTYNYTLQEGYTSLRVKLNGQDVNASGIIKMDKNYKLEAKSEGQISQQNTLLVIRESGVDGDPVTGSYTYERGSVVNYNYNLMSGFTNLQVKLDGNTVSNSGTITMDTGHTLHASAVPTSGQVTLTVSRGSGVDGSPDSGTYNYQVGDTVNYSYTLQSGATYLEVKLDGSIVSSSGTITMDRSHTLNATASGGSDKYVLTVNRGTGVTGPLASGTYEFNQGAEADYNYSLESGYTDLVVKLDGNTVAASGNFTMNGNRTLTASATPAAAIGELKVTSDPKKAEIWIDGVNTGKTTTSVLQLTAGTYTVTLKLTGYIDATGQATVIGGSQVTFHRDLVAE